MYGNGNFNSPYPLEENQFQFDANTAPIQLQLFGSTTFPAAHNAASVNYNGNNNPSIINQSNKRKNDEEDMRQRKLQISLSNFHQDDADQLALTAIPSAVSTGLRLSYEDDEHNSSVTSPSGSMSSLPIMMSLGDSLRSEMNRHNEEIEHYIRIQEELIIKGVKEMNQKQTVAILAALERAVGKKLCEKDFEVESINRKNKKLNDQIRLAAMEVQSWQSRALYTESVVNTLKGKLMQAVAQGVNHAREGYGDSEVDSTASCQNPNVVPGAFLQSGVLRNKTTVAEQAACRLCNAKEASVLLFPCRHICLCVDCERFIEVCPVCQSLKSDSVAINLS